MKEIKARTCKYEIIAENQNPRSIPYPYLRDIDGDCIMYSLSSLHGRSNVITRDEDGRYIVSKGNGLSFTQMKFLHTGEMGQNTLGLLLISDAMRDYNVGIEIAQLGIKTNHMEYVLRLDYPITVRGEIIKPVLLQYDVECPYRIEDSPFMTSSQIMAEVTKWEALNINRREQKSMIAADVLLQNLRIMHDNGILHNALTTHNHTWALELLDFEIAHTPNYPYSEADDRRHVKDLLSREILDIYRIILYIADVLHEEVSFQTLDHLFLEYEFDLKSYNVDSL